MASLQTWQMLLTTSFQESTTTKTSHIQAWKKDLHTRYNLVQWQKALSTTHAATRSVNLWEFLLRWYLTPYRISKFPPTHPLSCCRNYGAIGTLYHILWTSLAIATFWTEIFWLLTQILKLTTPISPGLAILSLGIETIPIDIRDIAIYILLSARLALVRHWKELTSICEVMTTHTHATYKMLFASTQGRYHKVTTQWKVWLDWYKISSKSLNLLGTK